MTTFALNLTSVRERLGKSQKAVAERLGLSPSLISKWEKGEREPDEAQVWELSRLLGVTPSFLLNADRVVTFQPRSAVAQDSDEKGRFGAALNEAAEQIHHLHEVWKRVGDLPARQPLSLEFSLPGLPDLAAMVRNYLRLNDRVSCGELKEALAEKNVLVFEWELPVKISGLSYQRDFSVIFLNRDLPDRVKLFTLCHELAHLLFHLRGGEDTAVSVMATRNDQREKEANWFAAELLMPRDRVDALVRSEGRALGSRTVFNAAVDAFGVSPGALFYRLTQEPWKRFDYTQKAALFTDRKPEEKALLGARTVKVKTDVPQGLLIRAAKLWQEEKATAGKVAEWCHAPRSEVDDFLNEFAGESDSGEEDWDLGFAEVEGVL